MTCPPSRRGTRDPASAPTTAQDTIWRVLTAASGVDDEHECARLVSTGLAEALGCRAAGLALPEPGDGWRLYWSDAAAPTSVPADSLAPLRRAVEGEFEAVVIADGEGWSRLPARIRDGEPDQVVVLPLRTAESDLGLLLAARAMEAEVGDVDAFTLRRVAEQLAVTLENLRLQRSLRITSRRLEELVDERTEELEHSEERLRALLEINNAVVTHLDRDALFRSIAGSLRKLLPVHRASLALIDDGGETLRVTALAAVGEMPEVLETGTVIPLEGSHLEAVVRDREPRIRRDLTREEIDSREEMLRDAGLRSYVSVPLVAWDRVLGTLSVGSDRRAQYGEGEADFLEQVGRQVGLAVENMLTHEASEEIRRRLEQENRYLRTEVQDASAFGEMVGASDALRAVQRKIRRVAPTDATALITGESGTGKELVAREIHRRSQRSDRPLVKVNCASVARDLYESAFFGHVKGAFTGATEDRAGRFETADGGTLFLDEVAEIPRDLQPKLLRVLEEGEVQRVGEDRTREVDVRVLAASNRDLEEAVDAGRFRRDLYYRLAVFPIHMPPLRERKEDVPVLARHFLAQLSERFGGEVPRLTEGSVARLKEYDWPGNVRELRNVLERAVIASEGDVLQLPPLDGTRPASSPAARLAEGTAHRPRSGEIEVIPEEEMKRLQEQNIRAALRKADGKIYGSDGAADLLGIPPTTLASRMKRMGIEKPG